jgi:2,3-dihydroxybenzoate decarboxylase
MKRKIGLEEHFAVAETLDDAPGFIAAATWADLRGRLLDMQDKRLAEMDRYGMEKMIVSLHAPGVQRIR